MASLRFDSPPANPLLKELYQSESTTGVCTVCILGWIAASDGTVSSEEADLLGEIGEQSSCQNLIGNLLEYVTKGNTRVIQLACEILAELDCKTKTLLLDLCIGMALADGRLTTGELYILYFLADAFHLPESVFPARFTLITGDQVPPLSDHSSKAWWDSKERKSDGSSRNQDKGHASQPGPLVLAFATLGLETTATDAEVRAAYRRLSAIHHPDRFVSLGDEAVHAATLTFRRISNAYQTIRSV